MDKLTIAYMLCPNDRREWLEELLHDLRAGSYPVREFAGIPGDVGAARVAAYSQIHSEYVLMVDPDDRVDLSVVQSCLQYLEENPTYAICACHERAIHVDGSFRSMYHIGEFDFRRLTQSPLELHNCCVFRTEVLKRYIHVLGDANFYNFDWALRLVIAANHPVKKLLKIGYHFRRKPHSHHQAQNVPATMIHPRDTVETLRQMGLIKHKG